MWQNLYDQIRYLAVLLASPAGKNFRSLSCIGFLPWEDRERYALVYEIPKANAKDAPGHWQIKSLYDLFVEQTQLSLSRRYGIAVDMAEVMLQLHTAGWLHKSIRSENIIFLAPTGTSAAEIPKSPLYLVGYEYARPDTPGAAMFTQLPDTELITDLYRHPLARGISREKYQKRFDMYAFGCLLVEIALWKRLVDVKSTFIRADLQNEIADAAQTNKEVDLPSLLQITEQAKLLETLRHSAGECFVEAIKKCLLMEKEAEEDFDVSLDAQQSVLGQLRQCKC